MNDDWMSWDIKLSLALAGVALAALVGWALIPWIQRAIKWHQNIKYSRCYLPHSHSHKPWQENVRVLR